VAHDNGPILLSCVTASTIRILVPLSASDEIVDEGLAIPEKCLAA